MPSNNTCTQMLKVCAMRILRLDSDGTILSGSSSSYLLDAPVSLQYTPKRPDRERMEVIDGCGNTCALYLGSPKAVDEVELELHLCSLDAEVTELLAGGAVITDVSYGANGYLAATDDTVNVDGVAVETWAMQWNGRQRALLGSTPAWYRHAFPMTTWEEMPVKQENAFADIALSGVGQVNEGFGTGLASDPFAVDMGEAAYGWFIDDSKPTGVCGYQSVP